MAIKKTSGLEKIPDFISRPLWKDGFIWWTIGNTVFWVFLIWLLFF